MATSDGNGIDVCLLHRGRSQSDPNLLTESGIDLVHSTGKIHVFFVLIFKRYRLMYWRFIIFIVLAIGYNSLLKPSPIAKWDLRTISE